MKSNYLLGDFLVQLNTGVTRRLRSVKVVNTRMGLNILKILYDQGIIRSFQVEKKSDYVRVFFKYTSVTGGGVFKKIELVSTPGKPIYWSLSKLAKDYNYRDFGGFYILSTPLGLVTSDYCLLEGHQGGQVLVKVIL